MKRYLLLFTVTLFAAAGTMADAAPSGACSPGFDDTSLLSILLGQGQDRFYNSEYEEAIMIFKAYTVLAPDDSVGFWREFLSEYFDVRYRSKNDTPKLMASQYKAMKQTALTAIDLADRDAAARPQRAGFDRYVKASTQSILALVERSQASNGEAIRMLRAAVSTARQSSCQEADFVIGSINYEIGERAGPFRSMLWIAHIPHDRDGGWAEVLASAENNRSIFSDDIRFFIFDAEKNSQDPRQQDETRKLWRILFLKYPRNRNLVSWAARHEVPAR